MDCKKVQDLLLTDYTDERLGRSDKEQIEAHLRSCAVCREFRAVAQQAFVEPFAQVSREHLPESVVYAVMEKVQQPAEHVVWVRSFLDGIDGFWSFFQPAARWALPAFAFVLVFVGGVGLNNGRLARQHEQGLFLADVAEASEEIGAVADYGTAIESYFLEQKEDS